MKKFRIPLSILGFLVASGIAVIYFFIAPEQVENATGTIEFILENGHTFVWSCLAMASLLLVSSKTKKIAKWFAYLAILGYLTFFVALALAAEKIF